ncbi:hypothetical protein V5O48_014743, partial [Marasmius crinis-equi]
MDPYLIDASDPEVIRINRRQKIWRLSAAVGDHNTGSLLEPTQRQRGPTWLAMNLARLYSPSKVRSANGLNDVLRMVEDMLGDEQKCRRLLEARDDEAQKCLDTLQLIKLADGPNIDDNLRSSILKMMLHLSKHSGLCPNFLFIRNVKKIGAYPVGGGRFGDVWKGKIGEQLVCLKVVK